MGELIIGGIAVDTEDVDLLVRYKSLCELDQLVKQDELILTEEKTPYWEHRVQTHRIARDIAEWMVLNDIPTVDLPRVERDRTQGLYALEKCRELEGRVEGLENYLKRKNDASKRKNYTIK